MAIVRNVIILLRPDFLVDKLKSVNSVGNAAIRAYNLHHCKHRSKFHQSELCFVFH